MPFGFTLSFGLLIGNNGCKGHSQGVSQGDSGELKITVPAGSNRAHESRRQRERELLADQESLYLLEAATAASSIKAKELDRESLAILISTHERLERRQTSLTTPSIASNDYAAFRAKGFNGNLVSYSPSFSTPSSARSRSETSRSKHEFGEFLVKGFATSKEAEAVAKKTPWYKLNAKLAAAGWSQSSIEAIAGTQRDHSRRQIDSVYGLFDRVEQKDVDDEYEILEEQLRESVVTPVPSPSSERGCSRVRTNPSGSEPHSADARYEGDLATVPRLSAEKVDKGEDDYHRYEASDSEEEWIRVDD